MLTATKPMGIRMLAAAFAGALALVAGLAFAQPAHADDYNVWVQGTQVTSDNAADILGDGTVSYDTAGKVLTLNDAELKYTNDGSCIVDAESITIKLEGENKILGETVSGEDALSYRAVSSRGSQIAIEGPGSLAIEPVANAGESMTLFYGFDVAGDTLTIRDGADISIDMGDAQKAGDMFQGISGNSTTLVCVDGANLAITANSSKNTSLVGVSTGYGKLVNGASVSVNIEAMGGSSYGVYFEHTLAVEGASTLSANFISGVSSSAAIQAKGDITIGAGSTVMGNAYSNVVKSMEGKIVFEEGARFRGGAPMRGVFSPIPEFPEGLKVYASTSASGYDAELIDATEVTSSHYFVAFPDKTTLMRIAGDYANETAALIAADFPLGESGAVVLARDDDFADALGATGLAGALRAPILLTDRTELSPAAAERITSLAAKKVYIIGGTGAMKEQLEADLAEQCGITDVVRVWGENSYDTSLACAKEIEKVVGKEPYGAIIAMSTNFQDALSMSGIAYMNKAPVILQTWGDTSAERGFTDEAKEYLAGKDLVVAGGPGAISEESLEGFTVRDRIYGETGYDTSTEIAKWGYEKGYFNGNAAVIACGAQAPKGVDALAGSAISGIMGAPILLVNANEEMEAVNTVATDTMLGAGNLYEGVEYIYVLGGTYVMPQEFVDTLPGFEIPFTYM